MAAASHHNAEVQVDAQAGGSASSLQFSPPDSYESGIIAESKHAHESWKHLERIHRFLTSSEVFLVNYVRALYRGCVPVCTAEPFVPGGSLFFSGAHIRVLPDKGKVYRDILNIPELKKGIRLKTSHKVGPHNQCRLPPMEIRLHSLGVVLVGVGSLVGEDSPSTNCPALRDFGSEEHTWIQSENAHHLSPAHWIDFLIHQATGHKQRGHLGTSVYSEKPPHCNPLIFYARSVSDLPRWSDAR